MRDSRQATKQTEGEKERDRERERGISEQASGSKAGKSKSKSKQASSRQAAAAAAAAATMLRTKWPSTSCISRTPNREVGRCIMRVQCNGVFVCRLKGSAALHSRYFCSDDDNDDRRSGGCCCCCDRLSQPLLLLHSFIE